MAKNNPKMAKNNPKNIKMGPPELPALRSLVLQDHPRPEGTDTHFKTNQTWPKTIPKWSKTIPKTQKWARPSRPPPPVHSPRPMFVFFTLVMPILGFFLAIFDSF